MNHNSTRGTVWYGSNRLVDGGAERLCVDDWSNLIFLFIYTHLHSGVYSSVCHYTHEPLLTLQNPCAGCSIVQLPDIQCIHASSQRGLFGCVLWCCTCTAGSTWLKHMDPSKQCQCVYTAQCSVTQRGLTA